LILIKGFIGTKASGMKYSIMELCGIAEFERRYLFLPSNGKRFHKLLEHYVRVVPAIEDCRHDTRCKQAQAKHTASIGLVDALGLGELRNRRVPALPVRMRFRNYLKRLSPPSEISGAQALIGLRVEIVQTPLRSRCSWVA
jgi:hypothetical protein